MGDKVDLTALEDDFVESAPSYSQRTGDLLRRVAGDRGRRRRAEAGRAHPGDVG